MNLGTVKLGQVRGLDIMGALKEAVEEDVRLLFATIYRDVAQDGPEVSGETSGTWAPFTGDDSLVQLRAEGGPHPPLSSEALRAVYKGWRLGQPIGVASAHPAMPRLALGLSKQARPGWIEASLKRSVREMARASR